VRVLKIVKIVLKTLKYCDFDIPGLKTTDYSGGDGWKIPMNPIVSSPGLL
jgi:hypothetical protein